MSRALIVIFIVTVTIFTNILSLGGADFAEIQRALFRNEERGRRELSKLPTGILWNDRRGNGSRA